MLYIYGKQMPLRWLEEIVRWKTEEAGHTDLIRQATDGLEPEYNQLMQEWQHVFTATEQGAAQWLSQLSQAQHTQPLPAESLERIQELVHASMAQTRQFALHLDAILQQSAANRYSPVAVALLRHISDTSYRYLQKLDSGKLLLDDWRTDIAPGADAVPIGGHTLPPLPYAYNALEPYIDEETMRIHHDILHQNYVTNLNKAEKELEKARKTGNFDLVKHWERELAFNGAGHYLHTLFWETMSPQGGGAATGAIGEQIIRDFGSYEGFKKQFSQAAEKVEGGGWTILVWSPRSHRLEILQAEKHQNLSQWDVIPLLPLDVWEHAYFLKHQSKRADYIKDWWNVVNWPYVNERFLQASQLRWTPY
ncbi:Fe-Mn family superoxide dismutase [Paenibacillus sp. SYP-B4298]|uniref:Fe-Mn family superoxide dismutase n=1 Tax=Paenibacillus sp. SYP-B4298 TaxID=2996034 RepID=UPI0022DD2F69|nr:Fe-Mn family superoxide dismutase [Paenibacillus sp. SYP-B4298]